MKHWERQPASDPHSTNAHRTVITTASPTNSTLDGAGSIAQYFRLYNRLC